MLRSPRNYLFVSIESETNEDSGFKGYGGQSIIIDTSYKPEEHAQQFATVEVLPDKLTSEQWGVMPYERYSNIEPIIKVGDKVWCEFKPFYDDNDPYRYVEYEGKKYYRVPYYQVFAVLRGDEIIPNASWVMGDIIDETDRDGDFEGSIKNGIITKVGKQEAVDRAIIRHIGAPLCGQPTLPVKPGDTVGIAKGASSKNTLNGKTYYVFYQDEIISIYE